MTENIDKKEKASFKQKSSPFPLCKPHPLNV